MKWMISLLLTAFLFTTLGYGQNPPAIQWELVNPFRFIKTEYMNQLKAAYRQSDKTVAGLERTLQQIADNETEMRRDAARRAGNCNGAATTDAARECNAPYSGWFARLAANDYAGICWDTKTRSFRTEGECKNYIQPLRHRIRVWISGSPPAGQLARWMRNGQPLGGEACVEMPQLNNCREFDLDYNEKEDSPVEIEAIFAGGPSIEPVPLLVHDRLIVGLGDSYASGEGNADIPAQFTLNRIDEDKIPKRDEPGRDLDRPVSWLERGCHRSLYSHHFKTALQLALSRPHEAFTYVSLACSGAVTENIIDRDQKYKEIKGHADPQLVQLRKLLQIGANKIREIDVLLLSTGGNDIGFDEFAAHIVLASSFQIIPGLLTRKPNPDTGNEIRATLLKGRGAIKGNYFRLQDALFDPKTGIRIKTCPVKGPCQRIVLTAYPDVFHNESGALCRADRKEFDATFKVDDQRANRVVNVFNNVFLPLNGVQNSPEVTVTLGWSVVKNHSAEYFRHGFCAQNTAAPSPTGEIFIPPTRVNDKWNSFDPQLYRSYESRQRWIRLPVDAKLITDQRSVHLGKEKDWFWEDHYSIIMHPTAEGHAAAADANLKMIEKLMPRLP